MPLHGSASGGDGWGEEPGEGDGVELFERSGTAGGFGTKHGSLPGREQEAGEGLDIGDRCDLSCGCCLRQEVGDESALLAEDLFERSAGRPAVRRRGSWASLPARQPPANPEATSASSCRRKAAFRRSIGEPEPESAAAISWQEQAQRSTTATPNSSFEAK